MAVRKNAALTAGFMAAFGLGVWTGPHLIKRTASDVVAPVTTTAPASIAPEAKPVATTGVARKAAPAARRPAEWTPLPASVPVGEPALHDRLKPVLNRGANMNMAADGFNSAEQFATVAHASRNTEVPFMLLKHRVLNEGDTLVAAIRKSKPDIDAIVEVDRARAEARSDLMSLPNN